METNVGSSATLAADQASQEVIRAFRSLEVECNLQDASLYYDYPLFNDPNERLYKAKIFLVSRVHGVIIFHVSQLLPNLISAFKPENSELIQLYTIVFGKLIQSPLLRQSRDKLKCNIRNVFYAPTLTSSEELKSEAEEQGNEILWQLGDLRTLIEGVQHGEELDDRSWNELRAIIEGTKSLFRQKERRNDLPKAIVLSKLESKIANFDAEQLSAAISRVSGPQRLRGLAGSGKTVVLASKAAQLHLSDPNADILITFWTKSLYDFFKLLITRFYRRFSDQDPDWTKINILHAWGGKRYEGVYHQACVDHGMAPATFGELKQSGQQPFAAACARIIDAREIEPRYDYVLIDEAQDLPPSFFRLCFQLCRGRELDKAIVWAYDELQTIFDVHTRSPLELFGKDVEGNALMDLARADEGLADFGVNNDIVLKKCYRNPREVLVVAHALGFGIYSKTPVQMLESRAHWEDIGYNVLVGDCIPGQWTEIERPEENSPLSLSPEYPEDEIVKVSVATDFDEELTSIVQQISKFISEGLKEEDIVVVCVDDLNAKTYFGNLSLRLSDLGIGVNEVSSAHDTIAFTQEGRVTLTTVHRAKGNEAWLCFVCGIDGLYPDRDLRTGRNKLFTGFTRAKAWLRISGVGTGAEFFAKEIRTALAGVPLMKFNYPDPSQIVTLQRDLSDKQAKVRRALDQFRRALPGGVSEEEILAIISTKKK